MLIKAIKFLLFVGILVGSNFITYTIVSEMKFQRDFINSILANVYERGFRDGRQSCQQPKSGIPDSLR